MRPLGDPPTGRAHAVVERFSAWFLLGVRALWDSKRVLRGVLPLASQVFDVGVGEVVDLLLSHSECDSPRGPHVPSRREDNLLCVCAILVRLTGVGALGAKR
jgi:hypothetical protein